MIADIQSARYSGGGTSTDNALRYARYIHFTQRHGARDNATKILILLTDGHSYDQTSTIHEADLLKVTLPQYIYFIKDIYDINKWYFLSSALTYS